MQLQDLLDELRTNILNDRTSRFEGSSDFLWEDKTLVRHINEAQKRFARESLCIRDFSTPEVVEIPLQAGVEYYPLHKAVIAVISANYDRQRLDLPRSGHSVLHAYTSPDPRFLMWPDTSQYTPGVPMVYSTDEGTANTDTGNAQRMVLRIAPMPTAAMETAGKKIYLRVIRLPINELSLAQPQGEPEIPEQHHLEMLDWAAYLALRIVDNDGGQPALADKFAATFQAHVKEAKKFAMRKLFAPQGWAFGRGGFRWEK